MKELMTSPPFPAWAGYARAKLAAGWRLIAWVDAGDTGTLLAGLGAVADAVGMIDDETGKTGRDPGRAVRHLLETDGERCLLVFDNADDPDALRPFIPECGNAQVLITTRRQPTASLGAAVPVDVFTADEAMAFLATRIGRASCRERVLCVV